MYIHTLKKTNKTNSLIFIVAACIMLVVGSAFVLKSWVFAANSSPARTQTPEVLPTMKASELKAYDGTMPDQPIYIGFEGLVYDVTAGKKYYQKGGSYHFLAGKDSTADLRIVGGGMIKQKYPVVARLAP